jgi:phenylalanyl-tRNA synthetase alpha subunit
LTGLDTAEESASPDATPAEAAERQEMRDEVLKAIAELPEPQREATALFYINGYSQKDIADFLEVPVGTVKNRLSASRSRLKERMLNMVQDTLHKNAPDERFDRKVIDELLSRPRPLEMPDHPVRRVWDAIRRALTDYEVIEGDEIIDRGTQMTVSGGLGYVHPEPNKVLRTSTTSATFAAIAGRRPPVRLLTAGRVFRGAGKDRDEDASHLRVFHQADALCIDEGAGREALQATVTRLVKGVLESPAIEIKWEEVEYPLFEHGMDFSAKLQGRWADIGGSGMLPAEALRQAGYDPEDVSCFAFGLGLERVAMLKYNIDDIRKLWQPPYVPG